MGNFFGVVWVVEFLIYTIYKVVFFYALVKYFPGSCSKHILVILGKGTHLILNQISDQSPKWCA